MHETIMKMFANYCVKLMLWNEKVLRFNLNVPVSQNVLKYIKIAYKNFYKL